jgi:plasmid stabilization system protein ParE
MPRFHLTRQAAESLREIHARSVETWGQKTADAYVASLYEAMQKSAAKPETGMVRAHRAAPFLMVASGRHFIVYDRLGADVVILALLHQRRNVEQIIASLGAEFAAEIDAIRIALRSHGEAG